MGAQSKERKGSNFAAQRSGAIVQKPEGPITYDLKSGYSHLAAMPVESSEDREADRDGDFLVGVGAGRSPCGTDWSM